ALYWLVGRLPILSSAHSRTSGRCHGPCSSCLLRHSLSCGRKYSFDLLRVGWRLTTADGAREVGGGIEVAFARRSLAGALARFYEGHQTASRHPQHGPLGPVWPYLVRCVENAERSDRGRIGGLRDSFNAHDTICRSARPRPPWCLDRWP